MTNLFDHAMHERMKTEAPLAARMRPRTVRGYKSWQGMHNGLLIAGTIGD
jgi:hypothetical protein